MTDILFKVNNTTLIIAVSGGPDSIYLACRLLAIQKNQNLKLIIAHFNHGLRAVESDKDQKFVCAFAKKHFLIFESEKADVQAFAQKPKMNLEEAGRLLRYDFLEKIRQKHHAQYVLTAHHRNDDVETIILNFLRGSGVQGLRGLQEKRTLEFKLRDQTFKIPLLRPLIKIPKTEILQYLNRKKIPYRLDKSNLDLAFKRNLLRLEILPLLKKINPRLEKTLLEQKNLYSEIEDFLKNSGEKWLKKNFPKNSFSIKKFKHLHPALQQKILILLNQKISKKWHPLSQKGITELQNLLTGNRHGSEKKIGLHYLLKISYNKAEILPKNIPKPLIKEKKIPVPGDTNFEYGSLKTKIVKPPKNFLIIPKNTIFIKPPRKPLYIRSAQTGDRIRPLGMPGRRKIQDIFTDLKIPADKRQAYPVLTLKSGEILAIMPLIISENAKITKKTRSALKIQLQQGFSDRP